MSLNGAENFVNNLSMENALLRPSSSSTNTHSENVVNPVNSFHVNFSSRNSQSSIENNFLLSLAGIQIANRVCSNFKTNKYKSYLEYPSNEISSRPSCSI